MNDTALIALGCAISLVCVSVMFGVTACMLSSMISEIQRKRRENLLKEGGD